MNKTNLLTSRFILVFKSVYESGRFVCRTLYTLIVSNIIAFCSSVPVRVSDERSKYDERKTDTACSVRRGGGSENPGVV